MVMGWPVGLERKPELMTMLPRGLIFVWTTFIVKKLGLIDSKIPVLGCVRCDIFAGRLDWERQLFYTQVIR